MQLQEKSLLHSQWVLKMLKVNLQKDLYWEQYVADVSAVAFNTVLVWKRVIIGATQGLSIRNYWQSRERSWVCTKSDNDCDKHNYMIIRSIWLICYSCKTFKLVYRISEWIIKKYSILSSVNWWKWFWWGLPKNEIHNYLQDYLQMQTFELFLIILWIRISSNKFCGKMQWFINTWYQSITGWR